MAESGEAAFLSHGAISIVVVLHHCRHKGWIQDFGQGGPAEF